MASKVDSKLRHKLYIVNDLDFQVLEGCPQTFWLPSDFPGFDEGFSTPVSGFSWGDSFRSQNRDGVVNIYIGNRIT